MVNLFRVQKAANQTLGIGFKPSDIWVIFRGFEFEAQRRNRERGAVSSRVQVRISGALLSHFWQPNDKHSATVISGANTQLATMILGDDEIGDG
jgi:hypothetical protein